MPVPKLPIARRNLVLLLLLVFSAPALFGGPKPADARIPLESLGFVPFSKPVLTSGASILTLNYVDDTHLLVTFAVRRLLKRLPEDPPQDIDRSIDAVLVALPSGEVLARTAWRMHDPAQYLWPLGKGRFLLRTRDRLTTIAPLAELKSGDAFRERPLLSSPKPIGAVLLSPDASLLIIEAFDHLPTTQAERTPSPGTRAYAAAQAAAAAASTGTSGSPQTPADAPADKPLVPRNPVEIHFYRLRANPEGELYAQASGGLRARSLVSIPADGAGFLSILDEGHQHWAFNYNLYRGHVEELSPFDSTCHPLPILVSRSEFIAFGCRSGNQRQMFGGFNLRGEEMWEQGIAETYANPTFAFAPNTGRFAFGRITTALAVGDVAGLSADMFGGQVVTVHQTDSGRPILRLDCTPVLPAGQNFDLSPDGLSLAIVRDSAIEVHHLPPLSSKDRAGIAKAAALMPELSDGPVLLTAPLSNANARAAASAGTPIPAPPTDAQSHRPSAIVDSSTVAPAASEDEVTPAAASSAAATEPAKAAAGATLPAPAPPRIIENGDPHPETSNGGDGPRKAPTLYNPGEHPDPARDKPSPK